MGVLYLAAAIIFTALAQTSYKLYAHKGGKKFLIAAIVLFVLTPFMAYMALKEIALSVVYMSTAISYVIVILASKYLLAEVINKRQIFALTLIICGVITFNVNI